MAYSRLILWSLTILTAASLNNTGINKTDMLTTAADYDQLIKQRPMRPTRRILRGNMVGDTRPYMVYLRPAIDEKNRELFESHWTCGGVIIHSRFVLTSAACIEDVGNFYVISGTHKFVPPDNNTNECVINGAKKAVWKCIPKSYFFDGDAFDNIRWMVGDIAIVKVEDPFNFQRRIKGCDFVPNSVAFNNKSKLLEKSGTVASVAGWGTSDKYINLDAQPAVRNNSDVAHNSIELLESDVIIISKKGCEKHWDERYKFIIDDEMICSKDSTDLDPVNSECHEHGVNCKEVEHSEEDYYIDEETRRMMGDRENLIVHTAAHRNPTRRTRLHSGGFCENDHGGPLIAGQGKSSVVIGVMSACLTRDITHKCYGPFLYTSVFKYQGLISCAIDKSMRQECRRLLRSSNTQLKKEVFDWRGRYSVSRNSREQPGYSHWHPQRINNQVDIDQIEETFNNLEKGKGKPEDQTESQTEPRLAYKEERNNQQYPRANLNLSEGPSVGVQNTNRIYPRTNINSSEDSLQGIKNVIVRRLYN